MMSLLLIIPVILLILISGLLAVTETAITAMSIAKIHKLKVDGDKRAIILSKLREDKENLISTIVLANNALNIISSTIATAFFIELFGHEGIIYSTLIMTIAIILFAEILPKTYALANPERAGLSLAYFLQFMVKICRPITKAISFIVAWLLSIIDMDDSSAHIVSPTEEIKGTIDMHHQKGSVDQSDKFMLDGVFYLGETHVNKVMTHRKNIQSINIDSSIQDIYEQLKNTKHTRIPVWKEKQDNIIGILNTRDLLHAVLIKQQLSDINIHELITAPMFVHENTALDEQLSQFKERKTRFAVVIDEYGEIQGLITLSDILEEVIGHIRDEHDQSSEDIVIEDGFCIVKGDITIRDLNRALNWHLPDNEVSTIAGLLIHEAERIPEVNENYQFYDFSFTILEKELNQLTKIKIEQIKE